MFYTYLHRRASDNKPFYIGKGKGTRAYSCNSRNKHWHSVVDKHGLKVEIIARWQDEESAFTHERLLIEAFRSMGFRLVNATDGGEGVSGFKFSEQSREKISQAMKQRASKDGFSEFMASINKGREATPEMRRKLSEYRVGKRHTSDTIEKISKARLGKKLSLETRRKVSEAVRSRGWRPTPEIVAARSAKMSGRNNPRSKGVLCVETGVAYVSLTEAAKWVRSLGKYPKAYKGGIRDGASGTFKKAYGFTWRYVEKEGAN